MNTFHLEILSPERAFYIGECRSLSLPVSDGMLGIMAHHTPLTAAVPEGEISFVLPDGERKFCSVIRGMVDVAESGRVQVLCESCLAPDEIDEEAERLALAEAKMQLKKQQSKRDYQLWQLSFNKAVSNLRVKKKTDPPLQGM